MMARVRYSREENIRGNTVGSRYVRTFNLLKTEIQHKIITQPKAFESNVYCRRLI